MYVQLVAQRFSQVTPWRLIRMTVLEAVGLQESFSWEKAFRFQTCIFWTSIQISENRKMTRLTSECSRAMRISIELLLVPSARREAQSPTEGRLLSFFSIFGQKGRNSGTALQRNAQDRAATRPRAGCHWSLSTAQLLWNNILYADHKTHTLQSSRN